MILNISVMFSIGAELTASKGKNQTFGLPCPTQFFTETTIIILNIFLQKYNKK